MAESSTQEEALWALYNRLSKQLNTCADIEASSALVNGLAAQGALVAEKRRLLKQLGDILDKLAELYSPHQKGKAR